MVKDYENRIIEYREKLSIFENEKKIQEIEKENLKVFSSNKKQNKFDESDIGEMHSFNEEELEQCNEVKTLKNAI